jgi:hypothetical protein
MNGLAHVIPYVIPFVLAAVLGVLLFGIGNFFRKSHSPRTSNKLMQWRVGLQAFAILLLLIMALIAHFARH